MLAPQLKRVQPVMVATVLRKQARVRRRRRNGKRTKQKTTNPRKPRSESDLVVGVTVRDLREQPIAPPVCYNLPRRPERHNVTIHRPLVLNDLRISKPSLPLRAHVARRIVRLQASHQTQAMFAHSHLLLPACALDRVAPGAIVVGIVIADPDREVLLVILNPVMVDIDLVHESESDHLQAAALDIKTLHLDGASAPVGVEARPSRGSAMTVPAAVDHVAKLGHDVTARGSRFCVLLHDFPLKSKRVRISFVLFVCFNCCKHIRVALQWIGRRDALKRTPSHRST